MSLVRASAIGCLLFVFLTARVAWAAPDGGAGDAGSPAGATTTPAGTAPPAATAPAGPSAGNGGTKGQPVRVFPDTFRGETAKLGELELDTLEGQAVAVTLTGGEGPSSRSLPATVSPKGDALSFKLPDHDLPPGKYQVEVEGADLRGELHVLSEKAEEPKLTSIAPSTMYPGPDGRYSFDLIGENLPRLPEDVVLVIDDQQLPQVSTSEDCKKAGATKAEVLLCYNQGLETRILHVEGFEPHSGRGENIRLLARGTLSEPVHAVFASGTAGKVRALAAFVSAALAAFVLGVLGWGWGWLCRVFQRRVRGKRTVRYSAAATFFLDPATNTYSLSKAQVIAWTVVFVFGYIYLLFCNLYIRCTSAFPDIPSNMPLLLGLSVGTTVLSTTIEAQRGPKGAGALKPSISDFITSGGLVAGDRFQFFVWTLVAGIGVLGLLLSADPASLTGMPDIPSNMLLLMGVSASGYLGGKIVRLPGPKFTQTEVVDVVRTGATTHAGMVLKLRGDNLSKNGSFSVDGTALAGYQVTLVSSIPAPQGADPAFCSELVIRLEEADNYLAGTHRLILTNDQDGQIAECEFPLNALTIAEGQTIRASDQPVKVTIKGRNFGDHMVVSWKDVDGTEKTFQSSEFVRNSDVELTVPLVAGKTVGSGRLRLESERHLIAEQKIAVTAGTPPAEVAR
jgi:hypothetical protein